MESDLVEDLKDEPCFSQNKKSMEHQLFHRMFRRFENDVKRNFDPGNSEQRGEYLELYGLEENPSKGFGRDVIILEKSVKISFPPCVHTNSVTKKFT